ncbi:hypothetical protein NQ317_001189, partial [Molorchus minor]
TMNDTAALVARRGSVKASITRIEKFVDEFGNDVTVNSLKGRLQYLEELYTKYDEIQLNLEVLNQEEFGGEREALGIPIEHWEAILVYILSEKLDSVVVQAYEDQREKGEFPNLEKFLETLEKRCSTLELTSRESNASKRTSTNATQGNHFSEKCFSKENCKICGKKHNTLVHLEEDEKPVTAAAAVEAISLPRQENSSRSVDSSSTDICTSHILLAKGITLQVTSELATNLNAEKVACDWQVSGVSDIATKVSDTVILTLESRVSNFKLSAKFGIMKEITGHMPKCELDLKTLKWPRHISLADPTFNKVGRIDILLGTEIFAKTMKTGTIDLGYGQPVLQNTEFGWIIHGAMSINTLTMQVNQTLVSSVTTINDTMSKFWKIEELSNEKVMTDEERNCEANFEKSVSRDGTGRYWVDLPVIADKLHLLGNSYDYAYRSLLALERRFAKNSKLCNDYHKFIEEYWCSNEPDLLAHIPVEKQELQKKVALTDDKTSVRTLGIVWNPATDDFEIAISDDLISDVNHTKRTVLSCIARIFDPLGFTGPVTARAKMIMQAIWKENLGWDERIPSQILKKRYFSKETDLLPNKGNCTELKDNRLRLLNPFLDDDCLLRVRGRLRYSPIQTNQRHPYILSDKCHVTKLIIVYEHERLFHASMQLLLANLRLQFWIINARTRVLSIHKAKDGCVRSLSLKTKNGTYVRPITKICPLPVT